MSTWPKKQDDNLICVCGHIYHERTRIWDSKRKITSFAHLGGCTACDCTAYTFSGKHRREAQGKEPREP